MIGLWLTGLLKIDPADDVTVEEVWMALKASWLSPVGIGSAEIGKLWNCPGTIFPPDQITSETAWVNVPSSVVTGFGSVMVFTVKFQPGTGCTSSWAIG
jgi:hypothetical protein